MFLRLWTRTPRTTMLSVPVRFAVMVMNQPLYNLRASHDRVKRQPRSGETTIATGASPWMGISTTSQPRAKRKLDRAQPQEEGRHRSCAAPNGASAECQSNTTGSRPWLKLYRRYAAKNGQTPSGLLSK